MTHPELGIQTPVSRRDQVARALQNIVGRVLPFVDPVVGCRKIVGINNFGQRDEAVVFQQTHTSGRIHTWREHVVAHVRGEMDERSITPRAVRNMIASWPPLEDQPVPQVDVDTGTVQITNQEQ